MTPRMVPVAMPALAPMESPVLGTAFGLKVDVLMLAGVVCVELAGIVDSTDDVLVDSAACIVKSSPLIDGFVGPAPFRSCPSVTFTKAM